jgi:hypothetical protein
MSTSNAMGLAYMAVLCCMWALAASAQEQPKWFVLRDQQTGYCRTAFLAKIANYYPHGFSGVAGGPYDTEQQALDRQGILVVQGVCQRS